MDLQPGREEGTKEPKTLQVVEMKMGEQDMQLYGQVIVHHHTKRAYAGTGIENEGVTARQANFDTRGIPAIAHRVCSRCGYRTAASPHSGSHQGSRASDASQNTATTPCISPVAPNNGYAVASY